MNALYKPGDGYIFFSEISKIDQLCTTLVGKMLPDGVHPSHFAIVLHLVRAGDGVTPLSLAGAMNVSKATISHSIQVLEKRGFIETRPCEFDARSKQVFLTTAGRVFCEEAINAAARTFNHILSDHDRQTMTDALPGLATIRKVLEANREPLPADASHPDHEETGTIALAILGGTPPR
ncbi:MAG: MarR family transcriptional regulator [Hoeflea sp.]|uniref:MarR family winged helix-turn-helix transcriptional regulator n=1 Tax=Hoeflea sp. TaxID=1940281 RepID=UPI001DF5FC46|nr:MarR family transcriptional regulator [Hoeflea sp.]MBU4531481.1 MarR family transcriptional regulator [Alphaproteobacteria bacterium]MBU4544338.1 MarR family transcriptional regulator [Alphaproteobacteria bacterium]MBU4550425.1 MarR family transcriptional regulator [Alphaproteobacteria bacterium]MBV1724757.1 MarR family transcriptional regulator [Hoeflea sp.]MBV1760777.1 MarR family transcriptional regulator [Hoeflea sp.]